MAEFRRGDHGIGLTMEVAVAPDEDAEIRRVSLTNHTDRVRRLALTSYGEVILAPQAADAAHPAFNKMFIESEYLPEPNTLLFHRRPRSKDEPPIWLAHLAVVSPGQKVTGAHETDRLRFLGRGRTGRDPAALDPDGAGLTGTTGATLDPVMALRQEIELPPHASAQVSFITLAADSREKALALARRYQRIRVIVRLFELARDLSETEMREHDLTAADVERFGGLLSALTYPRAALRAGRETLAANTLGQPGLWPFGISGDHPILLVRMDKSDDLTLVEATLQAHRYWRERKIPVDLVILNQQSTTYGQELRGQLQRLLVHQDSEAWFNRRGGIFILYADQLSAPARALLESAARVVLDGSKGPLVSQLKALNRQPTRLPPFVSIPPEPIQEAAPRLERPRDLLFDNGLGGFSPDGREYVIQL
jgi:cyclic beta-1,2-glucan synthetase